jgi:hypothetical protein
VLLNGFLETFLCTFPWIDKLGRYQRDSILYFHPLRWKIIIWSSAA